MPVFPSAEWMQAFCGGLQAHPRVEDLAHTLDGVYRFVVEPAGPVTTTHSYDVAITAADDAAPASVRLLPVDGTPRLSMTADFERWRQLIRGDLDLPMAVMLRRLRVSGDLSKVLSQLETTTPLLEALRQVDTTWPDDPA